MTTIGALARLLALLLACFLAGVPVGLLCALAGVIEPHGL